MPTSTEVAPAVLLTNPSACTDASRGRKCTNAEPGRGGLFVHAKHVVVAVLHRRLGSSVLTPCICPTDGSLHLTTTRATSPKIDNPVADSYTDATTDATNDVMATHTGAETNLLQEKPSAAASIDQPETNLLQEKPSAAASIDQPETNLLQEEPSAAPTHPQKEGLCVPPTHSWPEITAKQERPFVVPSYQSDPSADASVCQPDFMRSVEAGFSESEEPDDDPWEDKKTSQKKAREMEVSIMDERMEKVCAYNVCLHDNTVHCSPRNQLVETQNTDTNKHQACQQPKIQTITTGQAPRPCGKPGQARARVPPRPSSALLRLARPRQRFALQQF
jgi:hypothetical protein